MGEGASEYTSSASQVKTWKSCNRKWYYDKVLRLPRPDPIGAVVGTAIHSVLEEYTKTGKKPKPSNAIVEHKDRNGVTCHTAIYPMLEHVWEHPLVLGNVKNDQASEEIEITVKIGDVPLVGKIDLSWREGSTYHILDYKSTKSFRYSLSEQEATYDPQTLVYSAWALEQEGISSVVFYFFYIEKSTPGKRPVVVTVEHTKESIAPYLEALASVLTAMSQARSLSEHRVPKDTSACYAYGGCPFKNTCWATGDLLDDYPGEEAMASFEELLNKHAKKVEETKPPLVTPPEVNKPGNQLPEPGVELDAKGESGNTCNRVSLCDEMARISRKPTIYFGCQPTNVPFVYLEDWMADAGFMERYSKMNKGQNYLTSQYNAGERVLAVEFATAVSEGRVELPPHLVVMDSSKIGQFLRLELRYITDHAIVVGRSGI